MQDIRLKTLFTKRAAPAAIAVSIMAAMAGPSAWANETEKQKSLVFGIVPQQSATRLAQVWLPFLDHLTKHADVKIRFATAKDIPTFEACLAKGAYDLAYMNPYHFTMFNELVGYQAFARQVNKKLRGLVVVRRDSKYETLEDLEGATIAFPSPAAFGASVIPRAEMKRRDMVVTPTYVKSHDSVYRSVVAGLFPAGGGVLRTFGNVPAGLSEQLRILYRTNKYTPHAFAAHPRVSQTLVDRVAETMLGLNIESSPLLKPLGMKGFEAAGNEDWNDVRDLKLSRGQTKIVTDDRIKCHSG